MIIHAYIQECLDRIDSVLAQYLPDTKATPTHLHEAMRYAVLNGGKRLRPLLVYATGYALRIPREKLDAPAVAVEFLHAYSLIHDDLPAMDNDDLRRGKPTCHIAFDEATAILAGDALHALAFETLANASHIDASRRLQMIGCLAKSAGSFGMVGGQAIDLSSSSNSMNHDQLAHMHRCKTGAVIRASIQLAALMQPVAAETFNQLTLFAETLGLAFQVQDDLLDVEGDASLMGKNTGVDAALDKATYPAILGMTGAKQWLHQLHEEALSILAYIDGDTKYLKHLTNFAVSRNQ
jgi:farnesyl diphosphate synthase